MLARTRKTIRVASGALAGLLCSVLHVPAWSQTTKADILARFKDQPTFLRGCWQGSSLNFDATGRPLAPYEKLSFAVSGIDLQRVELHSDSLELEGQRVGLRVNASGQFERVKLEGGSYRGKVHLRIAGVPGEDYRQALDAVVAPDLDAIVPSMSQYFLAVGASYLMQAGVPLSGSASPTGLNPASDAIPPPTEKIGGAVLPPQVISQVDARINEESRVLHYAAISRVHAWLTADGTINRLTVERPAGMGLDECALAAVAQYKFKPATKDGIGVPVDLYLAISFRVF